MLWDANLESWLDLSSKKKTQLKVIYGHKLKKKFGGFLLAFYTVVRTIFFVIAAYFFCNFQYFHNLSSKRVLPFFFLKN